MDRIYKLTNNSITFDEHVLKQVEYIDSSLSTNKKLGGYIETIENLTGNALIEERVKVYNQSLVTDKAYISGDCIIRNNASVRDGAVIYGNLITIENSACVCENALIRGNDIIISNYVYLGYGACIGNGARILSPEDCIVLLVSDFDPITIYYTTEDYHISLSYMDYSIKNFLNINDDEIITPKTKKIIENIIRILSRDKT
jgi:NDP-sugar pyrophosphorylase family protein